MAYNVRLTYTPEGGSKRSWEIDVQDPAWDLTYNSEKVTGWTWPEFAAKLENGSIIALQALLWTLRKRDEPRLPLEAVQPRYSECVLEDVEDEAPAAEGDEAPKDNPPS